MNGAEDFRPRPGQRRILEYEGGLLGVAAVPGSGKTTTIAHLAAELLHRRSRGLGPLTAAGRVLVVTYQAAAADALRGRIARALAGRRLPPAGYEVRTLHSLAFGIVQTWPGHAGTDSDFRVLDERSQQELIDRALGEWSAGNRHRWEPLAPGERRDTAWEERWGRIGAEIARTVIAGAKNRRLDAGGLLALLSAAADRGENGDLPLRLLAIGAELYGRYQLLVENGGGIDFNDMVRLAVDLLASHEDVAQRLGARWPVVLEDEAQDSVPLQEELLGRLTSGSGHWIRVGDPNQSITSTFTSADPRFLRRFLERGDVGTVEMSVSGRCAPGIMGLANGLVAWTCEAYPVPEVRQEAFRRQRMDPAGAGDPQPNPEDGDSAVALRAFDHRAEELAYAARRALGFTRARPECTLAVLVPTNRLGFEMAEVLRQEGVSFDERLTTTRRSREVIDRLARVLTFVANPLLPAALEGVFRATAGEGPETEDLRPLVRSCYRPESLLYPALGVSVADAFPPVARRHGDLQPLGALAHRSRRWLEAGRFPVDQLALAVAAELFEGDDLARAQRVAGYLRRRTDQNPGWRLPELAADLQRPEAAREILGAGDEAAYEPQPGQLTLTTMHKSKGMEWDLVYLVGVDGIEFPGAPEDFFRGHQPHLGGDPAYMARARLEGLLGAEPRPSVAGAGQLEYICERLRLLYVAITRARRFLAVSFSRTIPAGQRTRAAPEALLFGRLGAILDESRGEPG